MSKSRGTFINAASYLKHLDPQYLRYYYACKMGPGTEDIDLNIEDFAARVNSDLVGKLANLASRSVPMLTKKLDGKLGPLSDEGRSIVGQLQEAAAEIADNFEKRCFASAVRRICALADVVNRYVDDRKPWAAIKEDAENARETITTVLNAVRILTVYLKPVLPDYAARIERILGVEPLVWADAETVLGAGHQVNEFERLIERVDLDKVKEMIEESKEQQQNEEVKTPGPLDEEPLADVISFDDFIKVDLRVARVAKVEPVEGADKLLRFELDLGGETRHVLGGFSKAYKPEELQGKLVIMAANLAPRKMRFGVSEGMILAAGPGGSEVFALTVDQGAQPGQRVH